MTLTFLGHVTSSVTWPIDPPHVISYWCPIVTKPLSLTVFEILGSKSRAHTPTHRHTPQVILYSVPCNVLHWTDNEWAIDIQLWTATEDNSAIYRPPPPQQFTPCSLGIKISLKPPYFGISLNNIGDLRCYGTVLIQSFCNDDRTYQHLTHADSNIATMHVRYRQSVKIGKHHFTQDVNSQHTQSTEAALNLISITLTINENNLTHRLLHIYNKCSWL